MYWFLTPPVHPQWWSAWLGAVALCSCPASWERIEQHVARPGKDQNSKVEVRFLLNVYDFHTIIVKLKHRKLNKLSLSRGLSTYPLVKLVFAENCGSLSFSYTQARVHTHTHTHTLTQRMISSYKTTRSWTDQLGAINLGRWIHGCFISAAFVCVKWAWKVEYRLSCLDGEWLT